MQYTLYPSWAYLMAYAVAPHITDVIHVNGGAYVPCWQFIPYDPHVRYMDTYVAVFLTVPDTQSPAYQQRW
ncbi:hypothetical protein KIPB_000717 [Kipferlia bialata]|uniref:Uncharacterized protein n=1 Tax=Kipferlia bialata TaxID=797122 RepID=A0A391NI94_9EUKA|nr:hypothetical protein KIPB_000717 [Kipferlia bialata]|eukprot:g717.t1